MARGKFVGYLRVSTLSSSRFLKIETLNGRRRTFEAARKLSVSMAF
jgi:hypothetical protein